MVLGFIVACILPARFSIVAYLPWICDIRRRRDQDCSRCKHIRSAMKVVVVGAGVAGLSIGMAPQAGGATEVTILERAHAGEGCHLGVGRH
jgi:hypothetical protein